MTNVLHTQEKGELPVSYKCSIVLTKLLRDWISSGKHGAKWMFPGVGRSEHIHRRQAYEMFMSIAKWANLSGVHVHPPTTRHTVFWTLWALDNPMETIAKMAHHRSTSTTEVYIRPTDADVFLKR
jgi:integrase